MGRSPRQNKTQAAGIGAQRICLLSLVLIISPPSIVEALSPVNPPAEELPLSPGSSVEKELPAGATHSYEIELPQKSFLRIDFYSPDVDLLVSITSPVGTNSLQWNIIKRGIAPIASVLDTKGTYQLTVRSLGRNPQSGVYRLAVNTSQPPGPQAQRQVAACRHLSNAAQYRGDWTQVSLRSAIHEYEKALRLWKDVGDLKQEAITLKNTGDVWEVFAEWVTALSCYEKARAVYSRVHDLPGETELINAISVLLINRGEYQRALDIYAPAYLATDDPWQKAKIHRNYGAAYWGMTELLKATDYLNQALELQKKLQDPTAQADTLLYLGYVSHAQKNIPAAEQYYLRSHDLFREAENPRGRALALTVLGDLSALSGESQRAMNYYDQSLKIFDTIGELCGQYLVSRGMAGLYLDLGETDKALQNYQTALNVVRQVGDMAQEADILGYTGAIYRDLGRYEKALQYTERAVEINRSLPSPQAEAYALANLGKTQEALGNPKAALQSYARGLELSQIAKDLFLEGHFLNSLGHLHHRSGQMQRALAYYRQALSLQEQSRDSLRMPVTLYNLARAERDAGNLELARQYVGKGLGITESLRGKVASPELRGSYLASVHQQYEFMIDLLMRLHEQRPSELFEAEALKISELARARSLLESLGEAQADIREGVDPHLLKRERSLQKELTTKAELQMQLLKGRHSKEQEETLAKEIGAITAEYQNVQALIRSHSPHYAALTQTQPLSLKDIHEQVLDEESLLLEYALGDDNSYLWAVTKTGMTSYTLPKRAEIENLARPVYELLTARQPKPHESPQQYRLRVKEAEAQYWDQAASLSQLVLGPVADQLGNRRLLIVAEGALQYVPFGALPKPQAEGKRGKHSQGSRSDEGTAAWTPLIVDHEIVSLPSASVMDVLRRETKGRKPAPKAVAVLADPVFEADDPRIQAARPQEGRTVALTKRPGEAPIGQGSKNEKPKPPVPGVLTARTSHASGPPRASMVASRRGPVLPHPLSDMQRAVRDVGISRDGLSVPRLLSTRQEANAIMSVSAPEISTMALGFQASRATATSSELSQYRIVHFATHGLLNSEHPGLSGLVLSLVDEQGKSQDGFLRLHDIYNLNLPADLVVLSACNTALGKEIKGEGLAGIVRGFMYAGAARVVASLWKVDDEATAELMKRFYRHMLQENLPAAAALRAAQVEMWQQKQWRSPYFWAGFVLQGEWR